MTCPFLCRCESCRRAQPVPYLYRPETDDEIKRHVRLLRQREMLSGVRGEFARTDAAANKALDAAREYIAAREKER